MLTKYGLKIATILSILLISAVFAYTHSGRTDKYGGHHDRKNGGYHYHNPGTVPRPSTRSTIPSIPTIPKPSTILSAGDMPYTPTRLEWLALDLNAGVPSTSIKYYTTGKANTIAVYVFYDSSTATLQQRRELMAFAKKCITDEANLRGWYWLKLEERYKDLK